MISYYRKWVNISVHLPCFVPGSGWEVQEDSCPDCSSLGHSKEYSGDSKNIETREIERELWGIRFRAFQRGHEAHQKYR